ncbi:hypothetical protein TNCV_1245581 [Trichonephila clavipes]|nr:hypothetical protein TNCV_1245581 [Trichonephila clavipes]
MEQRKAVSLEHLVRYHEDGNGLLFWIVTREIRGKQAEVTWCDIWRERRMLEHSNTFVRQELFCRERNVSRGVVLVQNPRVVALQIQPFLPYSFSKLSRDFDIVMLFCSLALRYPFNHDDVFEAFFVNCRLV